MAAGFSPPFGHPSLLRTNLRVPGWPNLQGPSLIDNRSLSVAGHPTGTAPCLRILAPCRLFLRNQATPSSMHSVSVVSRALFLFVVERRFEISCCFPRGSMSLFLLES